MTPRGRSSATEPVGYEVANSELAAGDPRLYCRHLVLIDFRQWFSSVAERRLCDDGFHVFVLLYEK
jgi:hypothetical protein